MSDRVGRIVRRVVRGREGASARVKARRLALEALEERALMTTSDPTLGALTAPSKGRPLDIATQYLAQNGDAFGFAPGDASRMIVTDQYTDSSSGTTHLYLMQGYNGVGVENARISVAINKSGQVLFVGGDFVRGLGSSPSDSAPPTPTISAADAILSAAKAFGLTPTGPLLQVSTPQGISQAASYRLPGVSTQDIPVHIDYVATAGGVRESWAVNIQTPNPADFHWYDARVDGATGALTDVADWVDHLTDGSSYRVYANPLGSPNDGDRTLLNDPSDPAASPYGWLDVNGLPGADRTDTFGNNVNAYLDLDGNGTGIGPRPRALDLKFDYDFDPTKDVANYYDATTTNLFYTVNVIHDVLYKYGFDEVAGNFQANDYGKGGQGNDAVKAGEAYGANIGLFNNAFMSTPPDGQAPLLASWLNDTNLLDGSPIDPLRSSSLEGETLYHEFNHGTTNRLTGGPANANALSALQSGGMGEGWSDWFALMFTQTAAHDASSARPLFNYTTGLNSSGPGLRIYPYSYDMSIDPHVISDFNTDNEVHDSGETWASALWDMTVLLTQKYGFSPDLAKGYTGTGSSGNQLAIQLVMDALKLQPANPSFKDARNAVLAADMNLTGGANQYEIWSAFARRGMGFSFADASSAATTVTAGFDLPQKVFVEPVGTISATELDSLDDVKIAEFYDATPGIQAPGNYTVSIDWGDGSAPSPGQILPNNRGGFDLKAVGKIYDEGGNYTIKITVTNKISKYTGTGALTALIADLPLSRSTPVDIGGTEGAATTYNFGTIVDTDPRASKASDFSVDVTWGDGTIGKGIVVPVSGQFNTFTVQAVNAFARFGDYPFAAVVTARGGAQAIFNATAHVADAPLQAGQAPTGFAPTEGQFFSGTIGSVIDTNKFGLLGDLSATITWGDGHKTPGLVINDPQTVGGFLVSGSNRYARFGDYDYSILIRSVGGQSLTIDGSVHVSDGAISALGTAFGLVEGQTFSGLLATVRDANPSGQVADLSGTVNWGDGTPSEPASFTAGGGGAFLVKGTHKFNKEGTFTIQVDVVSAGGQTTSTTTQATVSNASLTSNTSGLGPATSVEGQAFSGVVANIVDGNTTEPISELSATIDWGDGTATTVGTITQLPSGVFQVGGGHTYTGFGNYTITTTISDDFGAKTATALPIVVADAPFTASGFEFLPGLEGVPFTAPIATFSDSNPTPRLADFTASIDWGDGSNSAGTVQQNGDGTFQVVGNHIFSTRPAPYAAHITINDAGGSSQTVTTNISIPNGILTAKPVALSPIPSEGVRFNALLATFTDTNPNPKAGEYKATIDWGDGTQTPGIILAGQGTNSVRGSHLFFQGDYDITVFVSDADGATAEVSSSVTIGSAPIVATPLKDLAAVEGTPFLNTIATFVSGNPLAKAGDFTATINWGDDTNDEFGRVIPAGVNGQFAVTAEPTSTHTFRFGAGQQVTVTVQSRDTGDQVTSTVNVADAPLKAVPSRVIVGVGQDSAQRIASLTDANPNSHAEDFSVAINWGDGTQSAGSLAASGPQGQYVVLGQHLYTTAGVYAPTATVSALKGVGDSSVTIPFSVTVNPAALSSSFTSFGAMSQSAFSGQVGTVTSVNMLARASDLNAKIFWGDGTTSPGTLIALAPGQFAVTGSHTYAASGPMRVGVSVTSSDGVSTSSTGVIGVATRQTPLGGGLVSTGPVSHDARPAFAGTGGPGDTLVLTAQRSDLTGPVVIGRTTIPANGAWTISPSPLLDGTYTVTATAADSAGNPTSDPVTFPSFVVDTVAPRITGVKLDPKAGKVFITIQDDRSGMNDQALTNAANYKISVPGAAVPIRGISVSQGGGADVRVVTLDIGAAGKKARAKTQRYTLSINGAGLTDLAGNALSEQFFLPSPTSTKNGYIAQLFTDGRSAAGPQAVQVSNASKPRPSKFSIKRHR